MRVFPRNSRTAPVNEPGLIHPGSTFTLEAPRLSVTSPQDMQPPSDLETNPYGKIRHYYSREWRYSSHYIDWLLLRRGFTSL